MSKKRIQCVVAGREMDESSNTDTEDEDEDHFEHSEAKNGKLKPQYKSEEEVKFKIYIKDLPAVILWG